jgi:RimJ/RimL family protein N-acetyltransferase
MIIGKRVKLKLFEAKEEIITYSKMYNYIASRSDLDHTEVGSIFKRITDFNNSKFWSYKSGTMMIMNEVNTFIGTIGYVRISEYELSVGYRLLLPSARKRGYMTEALKIFTEYLFDSIPNIVRLSLYTASNNIPSKRLAEKCGFEFEGTMRKAYFYRGNIHDQDVYSIIKE